MTQNKTPSAEDEYAELPMAAAMGSHDAPSVNVLTSISAIREVGDGAYGNCGNTPLSKELV
ncbi:hypothetical protein EV421DRAFT_1900647 [Armillaria borealis]|uniref:Uncharacterized protein n=1 Tax=Armillaria borealis TaxID=47425 RepID=A0AA39JV28_9AGAR|nr:hypothetical protein EV421DRAFT_1900647 [Armillaria borealis]